MKPWSAAFAVLASFGSVAPSNAGDRGPVCRLPTVVAEITREVHAQNYYSKVNPELVTETPTLIPNLVHCGVCVQLAPYDMTRFGEQPVKRCVEHGFDVQILQSGFVVHDLR
jgi:hypothetical protein